MRFPAPAAFVLLLSASAGRVVRAFGTVGVPESYPVDGDGRIIWHRAGEIGPALASLRRAIPAAP